MTGNPVMMKYYKFIKIKISFNPITDGGGAVFKTRIALKVNLNPLGAKNERRYFLTFPKYAQRPF
jgi:hypothetical protein